MAGIIDKMSWSDPGRKSSDTGLRLGCTGAGKAAEATSINRRDL